MAPPTLVFTTEASRLPACLNRHHFEPIYAVNIGLKKKAPGAAPGNCPRQTDLDFKRKSHELPPNIAQTAPDEYCDLRQECDVH